MNKEVNYMEMAVMNTAGEEQEMCLNILKALEQKKKLNKFRIKTLKIITWIAIFFFLVGACALDNEDITIPVILTVASGSWLALMVFANK